MRILLGFYATFNWGKTGNRIVLQHISTLVILINQRYKEPEDKYTNIAHPNIQQHFNPQQMEIELGKGIPTSPIIPLPKYYACLAVCQAQVINKSNLSREWGW